MNRYANGKFSYPFGCGPQIEGLLAYSASGHMSVIISGEGDDGIMRLTAYWGRAWSLDSKGLRIIHCLEGSFAGDQVGEQKTRFATIDGSLLRLSGTWSGTDSAELTMVCQRLALACDSTA